MIFGKRIKTAITVKTTVITMTTLMMISLFPCTARTVSENVLKD